MSSDKTCSRCVHRHVCGYRALGPPDYFCGPSLPHFRAEDAAGGEVRCGECEGTGEVVRHGCGVPWTCGACRGTGRIDPAPASPAPCATCGGGEITDYECRSADACDMADDDQECIEDCAEPDLVPAGHDEPCPECQGKGVKFTHTPCPSCSTPSAADAALAAEARVMDASRAALERERAADADTGRLTGEGAGWCDVPACFGEAMKRNKECYQCGRDAACTDTIHAAGFSSVPYEQFRPSPTSEADTGSEGEGMRFAHCRECPVFSFGKRVATFEGSEMRRCPVMEREVWGQYSPPPRCPLARQSAPSPCKPDAEPSSGDPCQDMREDRLAPEGKCYMLHYEDGTSVVLSDDEAPATRADLDALTERVEEIEQRARDLKADQRIDQDRESRRLDALTERVGLLARNVETGCEDTADNYTRIAAAERAIREVAGLVFDALAYHTSEGDLSENGRPDRISESLRRIADGGGHDQD